MDQYAAYDITEEDPYLIDGTTCLKNLLGITDTPSLNEAEVEITNITLPSLAIDPIPATFDLDHLRAIHKRIFEDIYPFAGEIRTTEIMKGGKLFLPYALIESKIRAIFSELHDENFLDGMPPYEFGDRAGYYLGHINLAHPFREGNGRTQRALINQLAARNGYAITWSAISGEAMAIACREARVDNPNDTKLRRLIALNTVAS